MLSARFDDVDEEEDICIYKDLPGSYLTNFPFLTLLSWSLMFEGSGI